MDGQPRPQPHHPAQPHDPARPEPAAEPPGEPAVPAQRESTESADAVGVPPPAGAGSPARPARRRSRLRLVLMLLGGMLALLCLGGVGIGFLLYDQATKPDRSDPAAVVNEYLGAVFVDHDETRAELFACSSPRLGAIGQLRKEIESRERELSTTILVNIEDLVVSTRAAKSATVTANLRRSATVDGSTQSVVDQWRINLVDEDGWHVCSAERMS